MKLNLSCRLNQQANVLISILNPSSYAMYSRTLNLVQLLYIVQTRRNILKLNRNSHTHLTETPSFAWYVAAALKPLCASSAHKQWPNCSIVHAYQNQPESTKVLIIFMIKEDFIIKSSFHHES